LLSHETFSGPPGRRVAARTGGNLRLLNRLLAQMERILEIKALRQVTEAVVGTARESQ
jgi:hypothetical protein